MTDDRSHMRPTCPDCGAGIGQRHGPICDVEVCPRCGFQAMTCECIYRVNGMDPAKLADQHPDIYNNGPSDAMLAVWEREWGQRRMPWTGEWPGVTRCRELGWYVKMHRNPSRRGAPISYTRCSSDELGATEDLNRLFIDAVWNPDAQTWEVKQ